LTISGAPQFKEKIGNQIAAIDDQWKIVAKVSGNPKLTWLEKVNQLFKKTLFNYVLKIIVYVIRHFHF